MVQYASSISHSVLENPPQTINCFNSIWMSDLHRLLSKYQIQIKLQYSTQKLQGYNDRFIMEDILENTSSITLRRNFNAYRLCLNITCLSEITSINGSNIIQGVVQGKPTNITLSALNWP